MLKKVVLIGFIVLVGIIGIVVSRKEIKRREIPLCKDCNIIMISLDTLAAKHVGCYGYDKDTAPNLCQFGKENILFSNSYAQGQWTRPSQTSVLTGLHSSTHRVLTPYIDKLPPKFKTIQEVLKGYGYKTYYFGPKAGTESWDESMIRGFDFKGDVNWQTTNNWHYALDLLKENQKNNIPTFLYLHTYFVHSPYLTGTENLKFVKQENIKKYPEIALTEEGFEKFTQGTLDLILESLKKRIKNSQTKESLEQNTNMLNKLEKTKTLAEAEKAFNSFPQYEIDSYRTSWYEKTISGDDKKEYLQSLYDEKVYQLDKDLKIYFDRINKTFSKDTIVIIFSDHGETQGERGSYGHCHGNPFCLYNEVARVPFIIKVPGINSRKIDDLSQGIDIFPTIMGLIGKQGPQNLEGEDLSKLIGNKFIRTKKKYIVLEQDAKQRTIVDRNWKLNLIDYKNITTDNTALYNLKDDLYEKHDLSKKRPDIVKNKIAQLKDFLKKTRDNNSDNSYADDKYKFPNWIDEIKKQKLIEEGYF